MKTLKWIFITAVALLLLPFVSFLIFSKLNETIIEKTVASAWNDGFEAIVVDVDGNIRLLHMAEVVESLKNGGNALLRKTARESIIEAVIADRKALHNYSVANNYPFVVLKITALEDGKQKIYYSVHYSARTYGYTYYAGQNEVVPLAYYEHHLGVKVTNVYK